MRFLAITWVVFSILGSASASTSQSASPSTAQSPSGAASQQASSQGTEWNEDMLQMARTITELLSGTASVSQIDKSKVTKNLKKLSELAHDIKTRGGPTTQSEQDPTMDYISSRLKEETQRTIEEVQRGSNQAAQRSVRALTQFCIQCHTRHGDGPKFKEFLFGKIQLDHLNSFEKAEVLAATRSFDQAVEEYVKVVKDQKKAQLEPFVWTKALENAVNISVRVQHNPEQTREIIRSALSYEHIPAYLAQDLKEWEKAARDWKHNPRARPKKASQLISEARTLIKKARSVQQYPADRSAQIYYLRASALLHLAMDTQNLPAIQLADAYYLEGITYEALEGVGLWWTNELFYESCIHVAPHTPQSKQCYLRLEESVYSGYSGSSGTHIPPDVLRRLDALKTKAI